MIIPSLCSDDRNWANPLQATCAEVVIFLLLLMQSNMTMTGGTAQYHDDSQITFMHLFYQIPKDKSLFLRFLPVYFYNSYMYM